MAPTTRRRSIPSHRRVPHRSPPPHPKRPPHHHTTHILRLPNELLTEIVILCSECRPTLAALIQTCNRLLDITTPHLYRSIRFSCGGTSPRTNDIRRVTSLCSALLSDLEFGNHVKSLRLDNLSCEFLDTHSADLGAPFATALRNILAQCVPNLKDLRIRCEQLYREDLRTIDQQLVYTPSRMNRFRHSPTGILQKCHLRNLETFHFEIPIANNLNLCQFLNKHPTLTDIRLGHTAGYYGHIDSETCPKLCLLPRLERLSAPDYYFYAFEKPIPSLTDIEVWMAPSPHGAMMTLVKQHLKHLRKRYTGRDGDSVIVTQPVLDYIAGIAPSLKSLTIIHRPGYPGTTKYFSRPGIHDIQAVEKPLSRLKELVKVDFTALTLQSALGPTERLCMAALWSDLCPTLTTCTINNQVLVREANNGSHTWVERP